MAFLSQKEVALLLDTLEGDYWRVALLCLSTGRAGVKLVSFVVNR